MSTKEEPQRKLSTRENVIIHICAAWSRTGGIPGFYVRGAPAASKSFHAIERYDVPCVRSSDQRAIYFGELIARDG